MSTLLTICLILFIVFYIAVHTVVMSTDNDKLLIVMTILWVVFGGMTLFLSIRDRNKTDPTDKISVTTLYGDYSIDPGSKLKFEDGSVVFVSDGVEYKTNDYLIRKEKEE